MKLSLLYLAAALLCGVSSSEVKRESTTLPIQTVTRPLVLESTPPMNDSGGFTPPFLTTDRFMEEGHEEILLLDRLALRIRWL